jgi:[protein-PII] uridylyltransferase
MAQARPRLHRRAARADRQQRLGRALTRLNLQIASAHITTYGERAVDVFYVKDLFGLKIVHPDKLKQVADTVERSIRDFDTRLEPMAKAAE